MGVAMTARVRNLLLISLGLIVLAGGVWWFLATFHQVPFEFRTPPAAEARRNRLLALERTLVAQKHTVFNRLRFSDEDFGTATDSAPKRVNSTQCRQGQRCFSAAMMSASVTVAKPMRPTASTLGPSTGLATRRNRKEAPHRADSAISCTK